MQDEQRDPCLSVAPGMPTAALRRGVRAAEHEARGKIAEASSTAADEVGQSRVGAGGRRRSAGRAEPTSTHLLVGMIVFQLETRTTGDRWEMRHDGQTDRRRLRRPRIAARYD